MDIKNYEVFNNEDIIYLTVTVTTPGISESEVEKTLVDGRTEFVAKSPNATGIIPRTELGKAKDLVGALIEIDTDVLLDLIPKSQWPACYQDLDIRYYFEGGKPNQNQPFTCDQGDKHKSVSGKTIGAEIYIYVTI
jgi:hypothetical protein